MHNFFDISEAVKKRRKERNQQPLGTVGLRTYARLLLKVHGLVKPPSPPHHLHWWCNAANIDIIVDCVTKSNATNTLMIAMLDVVSSIEDKQHSRFPVYCGFSLAFYYQCLGCKVIPCSNPVI